MEYTHPVNVRLTEAMHAALEAATSGLYAPTKADIIRRGIELALLEYQQTLGHKRIKKR